VQRFSDIMDARRRRAGCRSAAVCFKLAANGNIAAAIFLAKNLLGYRDVVNNEHTGLAGGPIQIAARPDFSQLTDEELQQLRAIADKTLPPGRD
jgi:hypothetical protein